MELRPPPPRPSPDLDVVCRALEHAAVPIGWHTVHLPALSGPWVGLRPALPAPEDPGSQVWSLHPLVFGWLWDVLEPGSGNEAPWVLTAEQDVVQLRVHDGAGRQFEAVIPVRGAPASLELPVSAIPPPPWWVEWSSGWSTDALHEKASQWLLDQGVAASLAPPPVDDGPMFVLGDTLGCTASAFDDLLALPSGQSAAITTVFTAALESLDAQGLLVPDSR